jgi:hypothetical protein
MEQVHNIALNMIKTRTDNMPNDFEECKKIVDRYSTLQMKLKESMKNLGITSVTIEYNRKRYTISFNIRKTERFDLSLLPIELRMEYTRPSETWFINIDERRLPPPLPRNC